MIPSRPLATACLLVAAAFAAANPAVAETGILALSGASLHREPLDPLLGFGGGRTVSLLSHQRALALHSAADDDIVLISLGTGQVRTADPDLADLILYDELDIGRQVSKLLSTPGSALLFETGSNAFDPESATRARAVYPSGETLTFHRDRGFPALPEPGTGMGLVWGAWLIYALRRRTSAATLARSASGPGQSPKRA